MKYCFHRISSYASKRNSRFFHIVGTWVAMLLVGLIVAGCGEDSPLEKGSDENAAVIPESDKKALNQLNAALRGVLRADERELPKAAGELGFVMIYALRQIHAQAYGLETEKLAIQVSRHRSEEARWNAANILGEIGGELALTRLIELLQEDEDTGVRGEAARAIAKCAGERGVRALIDAVDGDEPWVAAEAARSLGDVGAMSAFEAIERRLQKPGDPKVVPFMLYALGHFGRRASPILVTYLTSDDREHREAAVLSLRSCPDKEAIPALIQALEKAASAEEREGIADALSTAMCLDDMDIDAGPQEWRQRWKELPSDFDPEVWYIRRLDAARTDIEIESAAVKIARYNIRSGIRALRDAMKRADDHEFALAKNLCASFLARFGDPEGIQELAVEAGGGGGAHGLYPRANVVASSLATLKRLSGRNYGMDTEAWKRYFREEWKPDFLYFRQGVEKQEEKESR